MMIARVTPRPDHAWNATEMVIRSNDGAKSPSRSETEFQTDSLSVSPSISEPGSVVITMRPFDTNLRPDIRWATAMIRLVVKDQ